VINHHAALLQNVKRSTLQQTDMTVNVISDNSISPSVYHLHISKHCMWETTPLTSLTYN